jgi:hypothetical protein
MKEIKEILSHQAKPLVGFQIKEHPLDSKILEILVL